MNIIVFGVGKVGYTLVENFIKERNDVVIIDKQSSIVTSTVNKFDVKGIVGSGISDDVLMDAGVVNCDFFISATSKDETNILACLIAKKLGAKKTIARVREPEFFDEMSKISSSIGVDVIFNPEQQTATEITKILKFPSALGIESFANNIVNSYSIPLNKDNPLIGKLIKDIINEYNCNILFATIKRNGRYLIPHGDTIVREGDIASIIGEEEAVATFCKKTKMYKKKIDSVFIVGGGMTCYYLAMYLIENGVTVKILEKDRDRCTYLAENLPRAIVINGDGTDQNILEEESISSADAFISLTGADEENVITSLFAKNKGVSKVVSRVNRESVLAMVENFDLDTVISPRRAVAGQIIKYVRSYREDNESGINTLYKVSEELEAIELNVEPKFSALNKPIKNIKFRKNILIAGIVRGGNFIIPNGEVKFCKDDKVIVITEERTISNLEQVIR